MSNLVAVIDLDYVKYSAAAVGEKRTIKVVHKQSGNEKEFTNRTEFWGRGKKKDGGWLGELNKSRTTPFVAEDFDIIDVQTPEPIENVLHTAKSMVQSALKNLGTESYKAFLGRGDSFRVERSTLLKYKGQRAALLKPLYLDDVTEYLAKKFSADWVEGIENDDRCVIEAYKKKNHVIIGCDKDFYGCPVNFYNVNRPEEGTVNCDQFGSLWRDSKGKVRGLGRMFLYWQTCAADTSDNYAANCFSDIKWADVSAYGALKEATNDKEAWLAIENVFKTLYPEPKEVGGWRGDKLSIDWQYVMNECFDMARMLRFEGDSVKASDVLGKFK